MVNNKHKDLMTSGVRIKMDPTEKITKIVGYVFVSIYALCCVIPFLIILSTSFTSEAVIRDIGVQIIPKEFTLESYKMVVKSANIFKSYILTISMTVVGTFVGLFIISMTGYALQRKDFEFRNIISFYIYFTSLFSAGLAPYYLLMTQTYHLKDSYLAVLLPLLMSPWLVILMKNCQNLRFTGSADAETGSGDHRPVPGNRLLERMVPVFTVFELQG